MKRPSIAAREVLLIVSLISALAVPAIVEAQTMDQYYAQPPFVGEQVKPNILILMDNSGSMTERASFTLAAARRHRPVQFFRLPRPIVVCLTR